MSQSTTSVPWIEWFCAQRGNEFFCEVSKSYIEDRFNLTSLNYQVPKFEDALDVLEDMELVDSDEDEDSAAQKIREQDAQKAAEVLYGLIHARFILTNQGIDKMIKKYENKEFGSCPRVYCEAQALLPIGLMDVPGEECVKMYCPRCKDVFQPKLVRHRNVDGAYFGTGFPHMLFFVHPELRPPPPEKFFEPRLYGFRVHPSAETAEAVYQESD